MHRFQGVDAAATCKICSAGKLQRWSLTLAWPTGRAIRDLLFGVESTDAATFALAPLLLVLLALIASLGPAWKSARVDAAQTLRLE